jgi:hypothetical protein
MADLSENASLAECGLRQELWPHRRARTSVQVTTFHRRQAGISGRIRVRRGQPGERPDLT